MVLQKSIGLHYLSYQHVILCDIYEVGSHYKLTICGLHDKRWDLMLSSLRMISLATGN